MDTVTPAAASAARARRLRAAYAAAPVLFLLGGAVLWRGLHTGNAQSDVPSPLAPAFSSAQALAPGELRALNVQRSQADQTEAYEAAQKLVRQFLLSHTESNLARFPAHIASPSVSVEKRAPALFRVRAIVQWPQANGAPPLSRRFEADLRHGPADMNWHLVDTEFLPATTP